MRTLLGLRRVWCVRLMVTVSVGICVVTGVMSGGLLITRHHHAMAQQSRALERLFIMHMEQIHTHMALVASSILQEYDASPGGPSPERIAQQLRNFYVNGHDINALDPVRIAGMGWVTASGVWISQYGILQDKILQKPLLRDIA